MASNIDKYKADLKRLSDVGNHMVLDLIYRAKKEEGDLSEADKVHAKQLTSSVETDYQRWYTEAAEVVRQLVPGRLQEFERLYKGDGRRKDINVVTYTIQDWLAGVR